MSTFSDPVRAGARPARWRSLLIAGAALVVAACGGGSSGGVKGTGGDFVVLRTTPQNNGRLFLNDPIAIDFSNPVDLTSADLNAMSFQAFTLNNVPLTEQPVGEFRLAASAGDSAVGRQLLFIPKFPTNDAYDNGGFRPARRYVVQLVTGDPRSGRGLRDTGSKGLARAETFSFTTADGTTPAQLFRDRKFGGPRKLGFTISPTPDQGVALNLLGQAAVELRLIFDQPLDPASTNVPYLFDVSPINRDQGKRGRIFLEYDDPDPARGRNSWIPADIDLEENTLERAVVLVRPVGVLPNNATVRVIVENTLSDISGETNVLDQAYNRVFAEFTTRRDYEPQFDAVVENFDQDAQVDLEAPFLEPLAELGNGMVRSNFAFQGSTTILDYEPLSREVKLNTDFTQIQPKGAPAINVSGGVFEFRNVHIPAGVSVIGSGTRPMVWLVTGDFIVDGELTVSGGDGDSVNTLNSANYPTAGGVGACGSGNGGLGSPISTAQSPRGQHGFGPGQIPDRGGQGGFLSYISTCGRASGGGGGSFSTQGDPNFKRCPPGNGTSFAQRRGVGGYGCQGASGSAQRSLRGGDAGPLAFSDLRQDNNFWGSGVDVNRQLRIRGELPAPLAGQGGGGGGDNSTSLNNPNWINDNKGGGGGAGGGVLIIQALGRIVVGSTGIIRAEGGDGGGGEQAGSSNQGGGGGGGSGGMIVLMSGTTIDVFVKGETYGNNDYSFSVSADGGVGSQRPFAGPAIPSKYTGPTSPASWDSNPAGGLGGMGLVQLMAPAGDNTADGTNTALDDNIRIFRGTNQLSGAEKQRYIAWRGFPNDAGVFVDDKNVATNIGDNEGDIRPAPILLPAPFGARSRMRSPWVDTGLSVRRALQADDGLPRGVVENVAANLLAGPEYEFTGTYLEPPTQTKDYAGYIDYDQDSNGARLKPLTPVASGQILSLDPSGTYQDQPAYIVELTSAALGTIQNRYAQYQLQILEGSVLRSEYRILAHTDRRLWLSPESGALTGGPGMTARVVAKFFELFTDGSPGLGRTYPNRSNLAVPLSNVRIGFAFHQDATKAKTSGDDPLRFPQRVGTFTYDLQSAAAREAIRKLKAPYVQWDLLFNSRFSEEPGNVSQFQLSPTTPRSEIRFLRVPYRF
jgi:hypothetical protein